MKLKLNKEDRTFIASGFKQYSRVIDFKRMDDVKIWYNNDKSKNILLIHHPKEYDLVRHTARMLTFSTDGKSFLE